MLSLKAMKKRTLLLMLPLLLSAAAPSAAYANHVFYPEGTDYWTAEHQSTPLTLGRPDWAWVWDPYIKRERYFLNGELKTDMVTIDNFYLDENGCRSRTTGLEEIDCAGMSAGTRAAFVSKSGHTLEFWYDGVMYHRFVVTSGRTEGDKEVLGDGKTPLGSFYITKKKPDSFAYLALELSYPNEEDADRGLAAGLISQSQHDSIVSSIRNKEIPLEGTSLGSYIQIHGCRGFDYPDSSSGCVELLGQDMEILYNLMELGDPVYIFP